MSFVSPFFHVYITHGAEKRTLKSSGAKMIIIQCLGSAGTMPILNNAKFYRILIKVDDNNKNNRDV